MAVVEYLNSTIAGLVLAGVIGGVFFVVGTLLAAVGQMLRAQIDVAVDSFLLLITTEKFRLMDLLRYTAVNERSLGESTPPDSRRDHEEPVDFCYHRGEEVEPGSKHGPSCGKEL